MERRNVVPDEPLAPIPLVTPEGERFLNRLSAFNRAEIESHSAQCGCFHCGSSFTAGEIIEWLPEKDGDDTALCPHCDIDAVIYTTEKFPLSTALLSGLYIRWFGSEYKDRLERATYVPAFSGHDDYLRRGIPFLMNDKADIEVVGEIGLFPTRILSDEWGDLSDKEVYRDAMHTIANEGSGGVVRASAYFDAKGYYCADFLDEAGHRLPYEPWTGKQQDLLLDLTKQYGPRLRGLIKIPGAQKMQLFIER